MKKEIKRGRKDKNSVRRQNTHSVAAKNTCEGESGEIIITIILRAM